MNSNVKYYEIGGVPFSVETPEPFEETAPYTLFSKECAEPSVRYVFSYVDALPKPRGKKVFESSYYTAFADGDTYYRYIGFFRDGVSLDPEYALATTKKDEPGIVNISIPKDRDVPMKAALIYRTLALEQTLAREGGVMLHSSFIETVGGAILFTAPSGVGKSTQAELWRRYRGAFVVNGDCSVIRKKDGIFRAYGLPFSGTSGICYNKDMPLRAIVYLTQAPENRISRLSGLNAFRVLYEGAKLSMWDKEDAAHMTDILTDIVMSVPVFKLDCVPDESAVETLERALADINV